MMIILSGMRIAIFGDVHGNLPALEALVNDLEISRPDHVICLGDIIDGFGDSRACVDLIREMRPTITVLGNAEWRVREWPTSTQTMRPESVPVFRQMIDELSDGAQLYLSQLPIVATFDPGESDAPTLLAFHGQPDEPFAGIRLPREEWPASWASKNCEFMHLDEERMSRSLASMTGDPATPRWLVCGHTHVRMVRRWQSTTATSLTIINPGPLAFGDYFNGGRLDAHYALLDADSEDGWRITWRTLDYDKRAAAESIDRLSAVTPFMARVRAQLRAEARSSHR